jgi:hypothetical protein
MGMEKLLFREEQRFNQIWLKVLLYLLAIANLFIFGHALYKQLITGEPWGDNPMSDIGLIFTVCFTFAIWGGILFLLERSKLITNINHNEIRLRFPPLFSKEKIITMDVIKKMEVRKYNPILEFGGWGIRYGIKGKAYNVKGNMGLQLYFKNGKRLLIGTQKPEQVKWAISKMNSEREDNS